MPQDPRPRDWSRRLRCGLAVLLTVGLASCATDSPAPSVAKAPMDVAMDIGGQGMFYKGTAEIPRGFNSPTSFALDITLAHWSHPYGRGLGYQVHQLLEDRFTAKGIYQPLRNGEGVISLASGRLLLRGKVLDGGQELDGEWFFDGKRGGGFRIARKGYLFP